MKRKKLFLKSVSVFLAAAMVVNPAGTTVYAGETDAIMEKEEAGRELVYAEAETSYKLYNNKTYEIINTTGQDIEIKDDTGLRKYFECAKYESDGTCTYIGLECYALPNINNGSKKEEKEVVTVVNKEAGADYYATITVPGNVTVKEIKQPALYHYTLNNHESCVITNPTKMNLPITDNIGIEYVFEYVKYDANGKCNQYNIKSYEVASLAAGENEKEVITLNYTEGKDYTVELAIPYAYCEKGVKIESSEKPAFYHYTLNNHESCIITNPTKRKLEIADNIGIEYVFEYAKYDAAGNCNQYSMRDYGVASLEAGENEKEVVTLNYAQGNTFTTELGIPYAYYEEGAKIESSKKPAFYHYTLNNHESCVVTNPTQREVKITDNVGLEFVLDYAKYDTDGNCNRYSRGDYVVASLAAGANEREVITLNYASGNTYTLDLGIPYTYYEEGVQVESSTKAAFYEGIMTPDHKYKLLSKTGNDYKIILNGEKQQYLYAVLRSGGLQKKSNITTDDVTIGSQSSITLNANAEAYVQTYQSNTENIVYSLPYDLVESGKVVINEVSFGIEDITAYSSEQQFNVTLLNAAVTKEEQKKTETGISLSNYNITLYNMTQNIPIYAYSLFDNKLSFSKAEVKSGDEVKLTISSEKTVPYEMSFMVKDAAETVAFDLVAKGYIRFITDKTQNDISKIRIFDETGNLVEKIDSVKKSGTTDSNTMTSGNYQVLFIYTGDSEWSVDSLEELEKSGYVKDQDYALYNVEVEDALITKIAAVQETVNGMVIGADGKKYWYENGIKQGTEGRGKEIYDPATDAWYWLDAVQGGAVATSKDVYQESSGGKWVRYDAEGHMIKGWDTNENGTYYFDLITGAMVKGMCEIDGNSYYFDEATGICVQNGFREQDGKRYWYENGVKQGTEGRGKEIYDPESDAWYWLDAVQGGAVATSKDVYQESSGGKWVRYDAEGHMIKGWSYTEWGTYYFDWITGAMQKGWAEIDGSNYYFDENTGILQ